MTALAFIAGVAIGFALGVGFTLTSKAALAALEEVEADE